MSTDISSLPLTNGVVMVPILSRHHPLRGLPLEDLAFSALPDAPVRADQQRLRRPPILRLADAVRHERTAGRPTDHLQACTARPAAEGSV